MVDASPMNVAARPSLLGARSASFLAWYAFGVLLLTTVFALLDRQIITLVMPSLQTSLHLSDLELGALQGLGMALFAGVAGYPIGWLADRYGRRRMLAICILVWSLATAACALQRSYAGLLLTTIGLAVGEAGLIPIIFGIIPDLFEGRQRIAANFIYFGGASLGGAAGMVLDGAILHWLTQHGPLLPAWLASLESWRVAMLIVAIPAPILMIIVATIPIPGVPRDDEMHQAPTDIGALRFAPLLRRHWRTFTSLFAGIIGFNLPFAGAAVWLPVALSRVFGLEPAVAGAMIGAALAVAGVAGILLPSVATYLWKGDVLLRPLRIARMFTVLGIVPAVLELFVRTPWQLLVLASVQYALGLATAAGLPAAVQDISPQALRSRVLSLVTIVTAIAAAVSSMLVGGLSGLFSASRGILIALTLVGLPGWLLSVGLFTLASRSFAATVREIRQSSGATLLQTSTGV
jgi:MFS family permease